MTSTCCEGCGAPLAAFASQCSYCLRVPVGGLDSASLECVMRPLYGYMAETIRLDLVYGWSGVRPELLGEQQNEK